MIAWNLSYGITRWCEFTLKVREEIFLLISMYF